MKARIVGFKGSRRDTYNNCCILEVEDKNPPGLIGKKVFWKTASGRPIQGKILRTHGGSALLARFKKGLPGFALGDELEFKAPALPKPKKIKKVEKPKVEAKKPKPPEKKKAVSKKKVAPAKKKPAPKKAPAKAPVKKPEEKKPAPKKKKAEVKKKPAPKKKAKAPAKKKPAK